MREEEIRTPFYLVDERLLRRNLEILQSIQEEASCKILLAQKAYAMFSTYPLLSQYLTGTTASGLHEARLGKVYFGGETHVFSPAFRPDEFEELLTLADHFVFNSPGQLRRYGPRAKACGKSVLLRINPECSTQEGHAIYDPCAPGSRLGTTAAQFDPADLPLLDGFHFHTLCEQNVDALEVTLRAFEEKFGRYLPGLKYLNLGGGHHITRPDYDRGKLIELIRGLRARYAVEVYLEPGEAVVYYAGFLYTRVLDTLKNGLDIAILDTSAACHMPDVIEMPYRPPLQSAAAPGEQPYTYRLAGPSCLAGDVIGDYSFEAPLKEGDLLIFEDMALYTMVKNNTFNGVGLPSIVFRGADGDCTVIREFGYEDFRRRLS